MSRITYGYEDRIAEVDGRLYYVRFTRSQRIQHFILLSSFIVLMLTGVPLLFPDTWIVQKMFWFQGSFTLRGLLHRTAALALLGVTVYHIFYVLFSSRGNRELREMVLTKRDFTDPIDVILYNLGKKDSPPEYDRFNFIEKFEYYAVVWGSGVMLLTGAALWFPVEATILFPRWVLDIIRVIHGFEAVLALLSIIIWHMYNVHLNPEVFPMSKVWLDGLMELDFLRHHHGREYRRLLDRLPGDLAARIRSQLDESSSGEQSGAQAAI